MVTGTIFVHANLNVMARYLEELGISMATPQTTAEIIETWHQQMKAREELRDHR
jgi:hypothetical protein